MFAIVFNYYIFVFLLYSFAWAYLPNKVHLKSLKIIAWLLVRSKFHLVYNERENYCFIMLFLAFMLSFVVMRCDAI